MPVNQSVVVPMMEPKQLSLNEFMQEIKKIGYRAVEFSDRGSDFNEFAEAAQINDILFVAAIATLYAPRGGLKSVA
jgi:hypothetical protein